ncbi:MAG TPA: hypothetical protein VEK11_09785 [Thermoanaerobaculia bacterium]|nr:hypothetical protein [Thermoanaerobaculia bacterium]
MRGRVKAIFSLILLLGLSPTLIADCSWSPQYSAELRTTALDVAVDGNFLWVATGYGVQLVQNDRVVDTLPIPGNTRVVRPNGTGLAYVGSGSRVHIVRREGNSLQLVRSVPARATVNDILIAGYLFVATSSGIDHFDLIDPTTPFKTTIALATSSPNVTSLAAGRNTLYAADGDSTVETFAIAVPALPQGTGSLESLPRSSYVHFANDWLFVSDAFGQNTDVFTGTNRLARMPFGSASFAANGQTYFVAGTDRTLRAIDLTNLTRIAERYEAILAPTDGTDNAIHAIARNGNTLYVAAGDLGLVQLDATTIAKPFTLVSYATAPVSSVRAAGDKAWLANAAGTITEQRIVPAGVDLTEIRTWEAGVGAVIRDARDNGLLTTNGSQATLWALVSATPTAAATFNFADTIVDAVASDAFVVAILPNGSVWTTPSPQTAPQQLPVTEALLLARNGSSVAVAEVRVEDGKTVLHYFRDGDFAAGAQKFTIDGAAIGSIALDATRAAVFTFNGINVVDLATGNVRVIADSQRVIPRELAFAGDDLLVLDSRRLLVYADARTLVRDITLPADADAFDVANNVAVLATTEGPAAALFQNSVPAPQARFTSSYPTKLAASSQHVYLFDRDGVDVYSTAGEAPHYVTTARAAGAIDLAASATTLYTLASNGSVTAWTPAGGVLAQAAISEGNDSQPLSIATVGNAVWVSLSSGCTSGNCQRRTFVLDPNTLAVTSTMTGAVRDVVVTNTRAYALFDTPNELRVIDIADALHPSQVVAVARPSTATSVAHEPGTVHVLGDKLYSFSDTTLTFTGDRFAAVTPDPAQQIRIEGGCAIVTGRGESPQLFTLPAWAAHTSQYDVPSAMREAAMQPGRLYLLTGHSLEIWSSIAQQPMPRRRSVR